MMRFFIDARFLSVSADGCRQVIAKGEAGASDGLGCLDWLGGRHVSTRCSSRVIRYSAARVKTAMIAMQANTVLGSKLPLRLADDQADAVLSPEHLGDQGADDGEAEGGVQARDDPSHRRRDRHVPGNLQR